MTTTTPPPTKIAAILFPGFQLLDLTGPLDILNTLSRTHAPNLTLSLLAATPSPVSTSTSSPQFNPLFAESLVPTHTFATAPADIEVLLLPGGFGARADENVQGVIEFLRERFPRLKWLLTVCTGSAIAARAGVLDGRRATSNKKAFSWVKEQNDKVEWVAKARWVADGNVWTSSGVAAGIDMLFAWVGELWGEDVAAELADVLEYERNMDPTADRFAERWGAI